MTTEERAKFEAWYEEVDVTRRWTYYDDVGMFHQKFELPYRGDGRPPRLLDKDAQQFREEFMNEELDEFKCACADGNLHDAADALADLVYVALGTAHMMGIPFDEVWREVQRANMTKVRATSPAQSTRGSTLDVVKPPGFRPPDHRAALAAAATASAAPRVEIENRVVEGSDR